MKAIRIHEQGGVEVLQIEDLPIPEIESDEVLIRVETAALNHLDLWVRRGIPGVPLPIIMGSEAAGEVIRVGERAHNRFGYKIGDEVINIPIHSCGHCPACLAGQENLCPEFKIPGESMNGVQADYIAVPAAYVYRKPESLSWSEAAAFPLASMTAYHMLVQKAQVKPEHTVLVYGASSGVGSSAVQIAKAFGATVITTVGGAEKVRQAEQLGADYVIRYDQQAVGKVVKELTRGQGVDIVIEHPGQATWKESLRALKIGGKLVTCGATTGPKVEIDLRALFIKHQQIIGSTMGTRKDIIELVNLIERRKFKPIIAREFMFEEVAKAHEFLEKGQAFGKVVLVNK